MKLATGPWLLSLALLAGCGVTGAYYTPPQPDAGIGTAKAAACAQQFGNGLTDVFGRLDGTVSAVVEPSDTQCPSATKDAVVVEVTMTGTVYKVVIDVNNPQSPTSNTDLFFKQLTHANLASWAEGWHPGGALDYAAQLGIHSSDADWVDYTPANLIKKLDDAVPLNTKVSVYGSNAGGDETTIHLMRYQGGQNDGALLLDPGGANTWLVLHVDGQVF